MNASLATAIAQVQGLLSYVETVERLNAQPAYTVPEDIFAAYSQDLEGLADVVCPPSQGTDERWLVLPRLQEVPAPAPEALLRGWIEGDLDHPAHPPELRRQCLIDGEVQHLDRHPHIQAAFQWYLQWLWLPWATAERPRRRTIALYRRLFALHQRMLTQSGQQPMELAWGIGMAYWQHARAGTAIQHPLLTVACDLHLDPQSFTLEVRPKAMRPQLEGACYAALELPGLQPLERYWRERLDAGEVDLHPLRPGSYEPFLRAAVSYLDSAGQYVPLQSASTPPRPDKHLQLTNAWVLFARRRSIGPVLEDIDRLRAQVAQLDELPSVVRRFVEPGSREVRSHVPRRFRGLAGSDAADSAEELYFPMPYNDEQVSIVEKLLHHDGVVVQGPPGTGKTHTIANVICHFLAHGKRVLVTAQGSSALAVVQEKLPQEIQPLCVSLLDDEHDGMQHFEHAIQTIAARITAFQPAQSQSTMQALEKTLEQLHAQITVLDQAIEHQAQQQMQHYSFQGQKASPETIARQVQQQAELHAWFDDERPRSKDGALPVTDTEMACLCEARRQVGDALAYAGLTLPDPAALPDAATLLRWQQDRRLLQSLETQWREGQLLSLPDTQPSRREAARELLQWLEEREALVRRTQAVTAPWLGALLLRLKERKADDPAVQALHALCQRVRVLEHERKTLLVQSIQLPEPALRSKDFRAAVDRLAQGQRALPWHRRLLQRETRKWLAAVTLLGNAPTSSEEWRTVRSLLQWRDAVRTVLLQWNALAGELALEPLRPPLDAALRQLAQHESHLQDLQRLHETFDAQLVERVRQVFPQLPGNGTPEATLQALPRIRASLQALQDQARCEMSLEALQALRQHLQPCQGPVAESLRAFLDTLDAAELPPDTEVEWARTWHGLCQELQALHALTPHLRTILELTEQLAQSGAPRWAERLRTQPAPAEGPDPCVPATWKDAWLWRRAATFLERLDGPASLQAHLEQRHQLTRQLAQTYRQLVAEKAWAGVYQHSPEQVRQALQAYLVAVKAIGKGTGSKAGMLRRDARQAMREAYRAVPCWVMPYWRVSEAMPAEPGMFDLVIVDEASQSDISAWPALLRAKKVLIVGDDKQVSPAAVGISTQIISQLRQRFLADRPYGELMTPDRSLYDLCKVVFAGSAVMLKEHFRCAPAIIEFSNREFYQGEIVPLRIPKAHERLDPPLVDVFVHGGHRKGDANPVEAQAIVDEIAAIVADPGMQGRSIGVVTLLGTEQAQHIETLIHRRIDAAAIHAHQIAVGNPPVFQGRERDIMLISMVIAPGDRAAVDSAQMRQRFNVALSRARDRMILFRSVRDFKRENSLNARVVAHFRQPFHVSPQARAQGRERCESGFEREVYDALTQRGYRVQPQVVCGPYRIDMVVEGAEGRRLAIECDGDRFHGPAQWRHDMARQRVLERAGWTFWRCFASTFVRRRECVLQELEATLQALGIEPLGIEDDAPSSLVAYREVDPLHTLSRLADSQDALPAPDPTVETAEVSA